jgi:Protein of unknown function (DUF3592)
MVFMAVFGAVTFAIGLACVIAATAFTRSEQHFERSGVQVNGRVVGEEQRTRRTERRVNVYYYPVVEYQTADGGLLRASTEVNTERRLPVDAQVTIRYLPDAPTRIRLTGQTLPRRLTAVFLGVGALLILIGLILVTMLLVKLNG